MEIQVSIPLAFMAGLVSFLSPCILPVVPSYLAFISGLTLGDLSEHPTRLVRKRAVVHSSLFVLGFSFVFMTMGLVATAFGAAVTQALPGLSRAGGVVMILFGLFLAGVFRLPVLYRELRPQVRAQPVTAVGSFVVGVAFGAGWTPCIGPILGSILLYASLEATMVQGMGLLTAYALGLGVPFILSSVSFNWFIAGSMRARKWMSVLQRLAGTVLIVIGLLMVTGRFASLTAFLAGMGQVINLEL